MYIHDLGGHIMRHRRTFMCQENTNLLTISLPHVTSGAFSCTADARPTKTAPTTPYHDRRLLIDPNALSTLSAKSQEQTFGFKRIVLLRQQLIGEKFGMKLDQCPSKVGITVYHSACYFLL
ncbi:hypothetical protein Ciccas_012437 [Cichlidogyrus casuarinus]|uniref:Uncharacterized protein n=1 Tax=Cichlidogyrus casuarinus TaxID=1844966 RepID=A0ABD2PTC3_9PLAT